MTTKCEKFIVTGYVQGVGFRYHTSHQALTMGLTGYAKNLNNGDVEVIACGPTEQVDEFYEWIKKGPRPSYVEKIVRTTCEVGKNYRGFEIL